MRVFVSEYVTCGAWSEPDVPASLLREGSAMLCALASDFAKVAGVEVAVTWDRQRGTCPLFDLQADNLEVQVVTHREEASAFESLCQRADYALVIAPEFQNLLADRCRTVRALGTKSLNGSVESILECTDKFTLAKRLESHGIPTIPTQTVSDPESLSERDLDFPLVIKPRDGAGSQDTYLIANIHDWRRFKHDTLSKRPKPGEPAPWILQPYIPGRTLSIAAILGEWNSRGERSLEVFPLAEQKLTSDGQFGYLGGRIPKTMHWQRLAGERVKDAVNLLPGLWGYVGVDLLAPFATPEEVLIVEVNPRLTTSYLGYRALADQNLAEYLLPDSRPEEPLRWKPRSVRFTPEGVID